MRYFWSIIAVLVVATAVVFLTRGGGSAPAPSSPPQQAQQAPTPTPSPTREAREIAERAPSDDSETRAVERVVSDTVETPSLDIDELLGTDLPTAEDVALPDGEEPALGDMTEFVETLDEAAPDIDEAIRGEYTYRTEEFVGPLGLGEGMEAPTLAEATETNPETGHSPNKYLEQLREARAKRDAENAARRAETASSDGAALIDPNVSWEEIQIDDGLTIKRRNTDGAYLVDNRHLIFGEGTADRPLELTWDMLYSVRETYRPRKGLEDLPQWTSWLDGKQVRITGFMATAVFASDVDELLIMKNEWDGCCIGVPPTPYDAVEVTLVEKIKLTAGMMSFGTISGRLEVEPYLVRNWLVGLYLLEDATVEESGF